MQERRSPTPGAVLKREAIHLLKAAVVEEQVVLFYQPVVRAARAQVERVEALLRWRPPHNEEPSLTDLIWSVERSPVIFKLENWILEQAFDVAAGWQRAGVSGLRVNVNLSARE